MLRRELRGWARAKHTLKKAQREQKADLDIQRKNLQDMVSALGGQQQQQQRQQQQQQQRQRQRRQQKHSCMQ